MRVSRTTLNQRLRRHVGRDVYLIQYGEETETGRLQRVGKHTWIRIEGVYFVSHSLDEVNLLGVSTSLRHKCRVVVRTTYSDDTRVGYLVRIGLDYLELSTLEDGERIRMLIPLNKVISMFRSNVK